MSNPNESAGSQELEVISSDGALAAIERASIDQQVATAHAFPRSIKQFMLDAKDMVTLDIETAEGCYYRLERKDKDGTVKIIEGPSVRLLEIAASCYGNIRYGSRVIAIEDKFVVTQGVAHDLQRNVYSSSETRRRITTKSGYRFSDDMIGVTANAACSIAKRNALNGVVPRVYVNQLCEMAKEVSRGTTKTLTDRRARAVEYFTTKLGVKLDTLLAKLGRKGIEEISLEDLDRLNGLKTAIKEGDTTVDLEFNPQPEGAPKAALADVIGKPADKSFPTAGQQAPSSSVATANPTSLSSEHAFDRTALLKACEDAMLAAETGETRVLRYARENLGAKSEHDELGSLPTEILVRLLPEIPNIKKATK